MTTPPDLLPIAAALIGTHGWQQFDYGHIDQPDTGFCILGSLYAANDLISGDWDNYDTAYDKLERTIGYNPVRWNDENPHTVDEVISVLLEAAT